MKKRFVAAIAAALVMVGLVGGISPAAAQLAESNNCGDTNFGTKVPVVMVHGWLSDLDVWRAGRPTMEERVKQITGIGSLVLFDYGPAKDQWITDPRIGPALAQTIDCLSRASRKNGGKGKVIVVAHSMGGLATRFAASQVVQDRKVADQLGLVVTLGTPNTGSLWANAGTAVATSICQQLVGGLTLNPLLGMLMTSEQCLLNFALRGLSKNSRELRELPAFPKSVPVRAIAGEIRLIIPWFGTEIVKASGNGDGQVAVDSALAGATKTGRGDGAFTFRCDVRGFADGDLLGDDCGHTEMYKTGYIQESVVQGVTTYLASLNAGGVPLSNLFGLQVPLAPDWQVVKSKEFTNGSRVTLVDTSCKKEFIPRACERFVIFVDVNAKPTADPSKDPKLIIDKGEFKGCFADGFHDESYFRGPKKVGTLNVSGQEGVHEELTGCNVLGGGGESSSRMHTWRFAAKNLLVYTTNSYDSIEKVEALLKRSVW